MCVLYLTDDGMMMMMMTATMTVNHLCRVIRVVCGRVSLNPDSLTSESACWTTTLCIFIKGRWKERSSYLPKGLK